MRSRGTKWAIAALMLTGSCNLYADPTVTGSLVSWGNDSAGKVSQTPGGTGFVAVSAGGGHSVALKNDGSLVSWGWDEDGRVSQTPEGTDFVAVSAGGGHSVALKSDGSLVSWGNDSAGQVSQTPGGTGFVAVSAGGGHSVALTSDGSLVSWGRDKDGQVSLTPGGMDFVTFSAGYNHSVALKSDGSLISWGGDEYGKVSQTPGGTDFRAVSAGANHSMALKNDGSLVSWGRDKDGQVSQTPAGTGFVAVSAGGGHSVALKSDGSLISWGWDEYGQVSQTPEGTDFVAVSAGMFHNVALRIDGSLVSWGNDIYKLVSETPEGTDFVAVSAGWWGHSVALRSDGSLISWGWDEYGQVSQTPEGTDFVAVSAGGGHSVALKSDGSLVSWGDDYAGQVSQTPAGTDFVAVSAGDSHSVALRSDGSLVSWGSDDWTPGGTDFVAVSAGDSHSVALRSDGSLVSWGSDFQGVVSDTPGGTDFQAISAGRYHSVALRSDGSLVSWGWDEQGQVSQTPGGTGFVAVSAGSFSVAIRRVWTDTGWLMANGDSSSSICGMVLYGKDDPIRGGVAGLPASVEPARDHVLVHFASDATWWTGIAVANPNAAQAEVTVTIYDSYGQLLSAPANWVVPCYGKVAQTVSGILSGQIGSGWIKVQSDVDVVAFGVYGNSGTGALGALPNSPLAESLVLPHFVVNNAWWTGVAIVNPGTVPCDVTLSAYQANGVLIEEVDRTIQPMSKTLSMTQGLFPLTEGKDGWILVQSCSPGVPVAACVVYGSKNVTPAKLAALSAMPSDTNINFSGFMSDGNWWTGIALVNPSGMDANITMTAYGPDGTTIDTVYPVLPVGNKTLGFVHHLLDLGANTMGWLQVNSDQPIVGIQILNANDEINRAWGMAGVEAQASGNRIYMTHYAVQAPWRTFFSMANLSPGSPATVEIQALSSDGNVAGVVRKDLSAQGRLWDHVRDLFGR